MSVLVDFVMIGCHMNVFTLNSKWKQTKVNLYMTCCVITVTEPTTWLFTAF